MDFINYAKPHGILWWIFVGSWAWVIWMFILMYRGSYWITDKITGKDCDGQIKNIGAVIGVVFFCLTIFIAGVAVDSKIPRSNRTHTQQTHNDNAFLDKLKSDRTSDIVTDTPDTDATELSTEPAVITITTTTVQTEVPVIPLETVTVEAPQFTTAIEEITDTAQKETEKFVITYVLNSNTMKFHAMSCRHVKKIEPHNYSEYTGSRDDVLAQGYSPCGSCRP